MKTWLAGLTCIFALGLAACGDKGGSGGGGGGGGSGPVGSWEMDVDALVDAMLPMQNAMMEKMMAQLPPEAQAEMKKNMPTREKMKEEMGKRSATFTFAADGTASFLGKEQGSKDESGTGTWKQDGNKIVVTPKTKDGKAVEGKDAEPKTLTLRDGYLYINLAEQAGSDGMPEEMKALEMRFKRK